MKKIILSTFVASSFLFAADYTNSIGMVFKEIPSGSFMMGTVVPNCPKDNPFTKKNEYNECVKSRTDSVDYHETPAHRVNVSSFYMGETEVTQGQWSKVMGDNPSKFQTGNPNMPVEQVNWYDAKEFIKRLNQKEGTEKYRLPTEEEWEYAARAGTTTKWYCGDNESCVDSIAVCDTDSPKPVKSKKPNDFGLYDMSGNVYEWLDGCFTEDYNSAKDCKYRLCRGGSWSFSVDYTRSANRNGFVPGNNPVNNYSDMGFRLLMMK